MRVRIRAASTLLAVAVLLVLAACGDSDPDRPAATATSTESAAVTATSTDPPASTLPAPPAQRTAAAETPSPGTPPVQSSAGGDIASSSPVVSLLPWPTSSAARFDADGDGWLTWDEYKLAVTAAFDTVTWPPTYVVTPALILANAPADAQNSLFQVGLELDQISIWLSCAWEKTWLDSRQSGDAALEAQALAYIVTIMPNEVQDDYSRGVVKEIGDKASLGDPSDVIQAVEANCTGLDLKKAAP